MRTTPRIDQRCGALGDTREDLLAGDTGGRDRDAVRAVHNTPIERGDEHSRQGTIGTENIADGTDLSKPSYAGS